MYCKILYDIKKDVVFNINISTNIGGVAIE